MDTAVRLAAALLVAALAGCASAPCPAPAPQGGLTDEEMELGRDRRPQIVRAVDQPPPRPAPRAQSPPSGPFAIFEQPDVIVLDAKCGHHPALGLFCIVYDADGQTRVRLLTTPKPSDKE